MGAWEVRNSEMADCACVCQSVDRKHTFVKKIIFHSMDIQVKEGNLHWMIFLFFQGLYIIKRNIVDPRVV